MQTCVECSGTGLDDEGNECRWCEGRGELADVMFEKAQLFTVTAYPSSHKRNKVVINRIVSFDPRDGAYLAINADQKRFVFPFEHWEMITCDPEGS